MEDREQLLHATEGEHGDEHGAAALDGGVDGVDEAGDFVEAFLALGALGGAAGSLGDKGVEMAGGESGALEHALILEKHVAGDEDVAMLVTELDGAGSGDVAGGVQGNLDLIATAGELFGLSVGEAIHARRAAVNVLVGEVGRVLSLPLGELALHDVGRVVEHALDKHAAGKRHEHGSVWMLAHCDRQSA